MIFQNRFFLLWVPGVILFSLLAILGSIPAAFSGSPPTSNISLEMERPQFWVKKLKGEDHVLLSSEVLEKMNEVNRKNRDLLLFRIGDLKENWKREEILQFLEEDWKNFITMHERRYGEKRFPLRDNFKNELENKIDRESIQKQVHLIYALIIKRTDVRVFPTDEPSNRSSPHDELDRFQHASLPPGSPIAIYHFSRDKDWAYVQSNWIRGWVRLLDVAIAKEKKGVTDYEEIKDRLVVTGNSVNIFYDPSFRHFAFTAQMGDSYPLVKSLGDAPKTRPCFVIFIPLREDQGDLNFQKGYIRADEDVHVGALPLTQKNIASQAFKMLNHPYRWGDKAGGKDCSGFLWSLFRSFGIEMPRNSKEQARVGIELGFVGGKTIKEKQSLLDQAPPMVTLLRSPGHIMLYLGKDKGRYYVIHSIWGIQKSMKSGLQFEKIGKVAVSDLNLGSNGPNGSLISQVTDIRMIGIHPGYSK